MDRIFLALIGLASFLIATAATVFFGFNTSVTLAMIVFATAFAATIFFTGAWIKIARNAELTGKDINKHNGEQVAESGGMGLILGISAGILSYIFLKTFFISSETHLITVFAVLVTILLAGILGFIDDIIGWKTGLKQWQKPLLTLPIAIPLMVIGAGNYEVLIPFIGVVNFGFLYPLVLIPIGVVGATNGFNMLAGLNGLEAGLGAIILGSMGVVAYLSGYYWLAVIVGSVVCSLIGFLVFNKFPAKVFPGDSLTYAMGALVASVAIVGNMQKIAGVLFVLYFFELLLKGKNRFKGESFGIAQADGKLKSPQKTISMTHVAMKILEKTRGHATEKSTVYLLYAMQIALGILAIFLFFKGW